MGFKNEFRFEPSEDIEQMDDQWVSIRNPNVSIQVSLFTREFIVHKVEGEGPTWRMIELGVFRNIKKAMTCALQHV